VQRDKGGGKGKKVALLTYERARVHVGRNLEIINKADGLVPMRVRAHSTLLFGSERIGGVRAERQLSVGEVSETRRLSFDSSGGVARAGDVKAFSRHQIKRRRER
jgi:hypothetical protein